MDHAQAKKLKELVEKIEELTGNEPKITSIEDGHNLIKVGLDVYIRGRTEPTAREA